MIRKPFKYYFVSIILCLFALKMLNFDQFDVQVLNKEKLYPSNYEMLKRTFPYFEYEEDAYTKGLQQLKILKKEQKLKKQSENKTPIMWEFIGPTNIGGRIVDIEFNPLNPEIVYAAAATGGVFKSTDTGNNWFPIFDDQPCLSIGDIGIDPKNPDVLYVGTGEANGGHNNFPGTGIYKSVDGGNTWTFSRLESSTSIGRIIVDPSNSQRVFVAAVGSYFTPTTERGVFLSEDGGKSWNRSLFVNDSTGAIDLVIHPDNADILYAAMWQRLRNPVFVKGTQLSGSSSGIYKTIDGGKNWIKLGVQNGLPDENTTDIGRIGLAISESDPSILYALYNDGFEISGLFKTANGGDNWTEMNNQFPGSGSFSWFFGQIRIHPNNPDQIFVMDVSLLRSSDGGVNWDYSQGYNGSPNLHVDHHALAFHPYNPDFIISGNDGGINISEDGGLSWAIPAEIPITQFYEIGLDLQNPERYYGGTQDNNTIRTLTGLQDNWERLYGGDGFYVIVDPNNPDIIYAESQNGGLSKSIDGGKTFTPSIEGIEFSEPRNWSTPVVMDPNNSQVLYYGTYRVYRSDVGGNFWYPLSPQLTDYTSEKRLGTITTIAVALSNSEFIYAGTDDGHVWISTDNGNSWRDISNDLPFRWVTRVAVNPDNENIVYATFSGLKWGDPEPRIFRSENRGNSWTNISAGLPDVPINAIAIDNFDPKTIYIGNDIGAFVSFNEGTAWELLGDNLPIVVVNDMKIHSAANHLVIGTHGRGMYKLKLSDFDNFTKDDNTISSESELQQNYPNPFNSTTMINYTLSANQSNIPIPVNIAVYNVLGKKIIELVNDNKMPGSNSVEFNAHDLAAGVYFYKLKARNFEKTKKMVLLK